MFNSGILDVVIGVVVVYLQISLVCTAINELVALWLKKRAKELEKGIRGLLTNPQLADRFYEHPLIKGLQPDGRKPSYIPARTFSLALMDIVRRAAFDGTASVAAANQSVADKEKAVAAAQAALDAANTASTDANDFHAKALKAVEAAGDVEKPAALTLAQDAAIKKTAAEAQQFAAQSKLDAVRQAKSDADTYLLQVTREVKAAKDAEDAATRAEADAAATPLDKNLQSTAAALRKVALEAKDKLAPSAASLLTEARERVAAAPSSVVPGELKVALLALFDNAGSSLTKAQANVEQWFDDAMDRVSGVYKRKSHVFVVIIAVVVTVLANVDTLQVADSLSHDKAVRDSLVAAAPELAKKGDPAPTPTSAPAASPSPAVPPAEGAAAGSAATSTSTPPTIDSISSSLKALEKLSLPIGYIRVCTAIEEKVVDSCVTAPDAAARESDTKQKLDAAQDDLTKAESGSPDAEPALQKATEELKRAQDNLKTATDLTKVAAQEAVTKAQAANDQAQTNWNKVKGERDKLAKAQEAYDKAVAKVAEIKQLATALEKARADLKADEGNLTKQEAFREAHRRVELTAACPKCRKEKELTEDQLTRRLPTTRDHDFLSTDGIKFLVGDSLNLLYTHWLGWLLTAMAVSLGAPFWFDMLNKLIVVRSTVKPHEKSKEQESKDNSDEKDGADKS